MATIRGRWMMLERIRIGEAGGGKRKRKRKWWMAGDEGAGSWEKESQMQFFLSLTSRFLSCCKKVILTARDGVFFLLLLVDAMCGGRRPSELKKRMDHPANKSHN